MIGDAIALLDLIKGLYENRSVKSALFEWDGEKISGDEDIKLVVHKSELNPNEWYYNVFPIEGYEFVRLPLNASGVIEQLANIEGEEIFDSNYFRYIPMDDGVAKFGGKVPNAKTKILIYGYKVKDLLDLGKHKLK